MKPDIGVKEECNQSVEIELNKLFADEVVSYLQTGNFHWDIQGAGFNQLHLFLEKQFTQMDEIMDALAGRIKVVGLYNEAGLADCLKLTHLLAQPQSNIQEVELKHLLASQENIVRNLRRLITLFNEDYIDNGSCDIVN